ncbi:MAG: beta-galactosidase [Planctomycetes bacterium]|nr:beta-galactosidase [Planctomycetota bacterium]
MPSLAYDRQSFIWNGRRLWMIGANLEYTLLAPERWKPALLALKRMGFNTIRTSVPWCLHEAREGRMDFTGGLNVAVFIDACRELGLHVVLRIGPVAGEPFDGGGLPAWLADQPDIKLRVANETFLKHVSRLYQAVGKEVSKLQATVEAPRGAGFAGGRSNDGGALCAVQIEHGWTCGNEEEGQKYHKELLRFARDSGFTVPVLTSNGLWISVEGCVEVWEGWNDLFANLRQLQSIQSDAPRLVEIREEAAWAACTGCDKDSPRCVKLAGDLVRDSSGASAKRSSWSAGMEELRRVGQILCAGGQPTLPGLARTDRINAVPALLDSIGRPDGSARAIRRLASFANSFGFVLAGADGTKQAAVQNLDALEPGSFAVVTVEGAGNVVFVFRGPDEAGKPRRDAATIITPNGVRMPVHLGDAPVGWYLSNVNLQGAGVLDFCNLSPFALIEKKLLVLQGAAGTMGALSIDGAAMEFTLPKAGEGAKPLVFAHQKLTVVVCNQEQIDTALIEATGLTLGADDVRGTNAVLSPGFNKAFRISLSGEIAELRAAAPSKPTERALKDWQVAECREYVDGSSDRFATLAVPQSLDKCGVNSGWGWYRLSVKPEGKSSEAVSAHFPAAFGFMQAWSNGKSLGVLGGKGATLPLAIPAEKSSSSGKSGNSRTLTLLARQGGRSANDASRNHSVGISGNALAVSPLKAKSKVIDSPSVDPFKAAPFLPGVAPGHLLSTHAAHFAFDYRGKGVIMLDAPATRLRAVAILNGAVIDFLDWHGGLGDALVLRPVPKASKEKSKSGAKESPRFGLKNGVNELVLVPIDPGTEEKKSSEQCVEKLAKAIRFFQSPEASLGSGATWSFARWEMPGRTSPAWKPLKLAKAAKPGEPRWFTTTLVKPAVAGGSIAILCNGLSHGHVLLDGKIVGDYCAAEKRLRIELPMEAIPPNATLSIFDVDGRSPAGVKLHITG